MMDAAQMRALATEKESAEARAQIEALQERMIEAAKQGRSGVPLDGPLSEKAYAMLRDLGYSFAQMRECGSHGVRAYEEVRW